MSPNPSARSHQRTHLTLSSPPGAETTVRWPTLKRPKSLPLGAPGNSQTRLRGSSSKESFKSPSLWGGSSKDSSSSSSSSRGASKGSSRGTSKGRSEKTKDTVAEVRDDRNEIFSSDDGRRDGDREETPRDDTEASIAAGWKPREEESNNFFPDENIDGPEQVRVELRKKKAVAAAPESLATSFSSARAAIRANGKSGVSSPRRSPSAPTVPFPKPPSDSEQREADPGGRRRRPHSATPADPPPPLLSQRPSWVDGQQIGGDAPPIVRRAVTPGFFAECESASSRARFVAQSNEWRSSEAAGRRPKSTPPVMTVTDLILYDILDTGIREEKTRGQWSEVPSVISEVTMPTLPVSPKGRTGTTAGGGVQVDGSITSVLSDLTMPSLLIGAIKIGAENPPLHPPPPPPPPPPPLPPSPGVGHPGSKVLQTVQERPLPGSLVISTSATSTYSPTGDGNGATEMLVVERTGEVRRPALHDRDSLSPLLLDTREEVKASFFTLPGGREDPKNLIQSQSSSEVKSQGSNLSSFLFPQQVEQDDMTLSVLGNSELPLLERENEFLSRVSSESQHLHGEHLVDGFAVVAKSPRCRVGGWGKHLDPKESEDSLTANLLTPPESPRTSSVGRQLTGVRCEGPQHGSLQLGSGSGNATGRAEGGTQQGGDLYHNSSEDTWTALGSFLTPPEAQTSGEETLTALGSIMTPPGSPFEGAEGLDLTLPIVVANRRAHKFWARCAVLAAEAVLAAPLPLGGWDNASAVPVAQAASAAVLRISKEPGLKVDGAEEGKGDWQPVAMARMSDMATRTSFAVMMAGGTQEAASAAAVAILGQRESLHVPLVMGEHNEKQKREVAADDTVIDFNITQCYIGTPQQGFNSKLNKERSAVNISAESNAKIQEIDNHEGKERLRYNEDGHSHTEIQNNGAIDRNGQKSAVPKPASNGNAHDHNFYGSLNDTNMNSEESNKHSMEEEICSEDTNTDEETQSDSGSFPTTISKRRDEDGKEGLKDDRTQHMDRDIGNDDEIEQKRPTPKTHYSRPSTELPNDTLSFSFDQSSEYSQESEGEEHRSLTFDLKKEVRRFCVGLDLIQRDYMDCAIIQNKCPGTQRGEDNVVGESDANDNQPNKDLLEILQDWMKGLTMPSVPTLNGKKGTEEVSSASDKSVLDINVLEYFRGENASSPVRSKKQVESRNCSVMPTNQSIPNHFVFNCDGGTEYDACGKSVLTKIIDDIDLAEYLEGEHDITKGQRERPTSDDKGNTQLLTDLDSKEVQYKPGQLHVESPASALEEQKNEVNFTEVQHKDNLIQEKQSEEKEANDNIPEVGTQTVAGMIITDTISQEKNGPCADLDPQEEKVTDEIILEPEKLDKEHEVTNLDIIQKEKQVDNKQGLGYHKNDIELAFPDLSHYSHSLHNEKKAVSKPVPNETLMLVINPSLQSLHPDETTLQNKKRPKSGLMKSMKRRVFNKKPKSAK